MTIKRIAVLGGGMAALTAVFELTSVKDWDKQYAITVYQVGWRLGGKGASGRNREREDRIEEHGFHFWWGFYDNAFHLIQRCYKALGRPLGSPLATWEEAFKPVTFDVQQIRYGHGWTPYPLKFPRNDLLPGHDLSRPIPGPDRCIYLLLKDLGSQLTAEPTSDTDVRGNAGQFGKWLAALWLLIARVLAWPPANALPGWLSRARYTVIHLMLGLLTAALWQLNRNERQDAAGFNDYVGTLNVDMFCAMMRGMIKDDVIARGYDAINEDDLRAWLQRNGAREQTLHSSVVNGIYGMVFAEQDEGPPSLEAGTFLRIFMRMTFTYKGAFLWRMMAGMGDTVFAPLYAVLKARGVEFKFFHRIDNLQLSPDGAQIDTITGGIQVQVKDGAAYSPLYDVRGLPCWPSEPFYEQLERGDELRERIEVEGVCIPKYNLESFWTPWQDAAPLRLERGTHFDIVLLGVSLGSLPFIASELIERKDAHGERWRSMVTRVQTIQTQALQLWLKPDIAGLGWPLWALGLPVMDAYDTEPGLVNSWADMSHLITREGWADEVPGNISYFASAVRGPSLAKLPPRSDHAFPIGQFIRCKTASLGFLARHVGPLWPAATAPEPGSTMAEPLNWGLLVDLDHKAGFQRLDSQFWKLNCDPSERYVLSVAGSSKYRLRTDESGCDNLFLTGDWINNGANCGYIDSAVISGMLAAQAITKCLLGKAYPEYIAGGPAA